MIGVGGVRSKTQKQEPLKVWLHLYKLTVFLCTCLCIRVCVCVCVCVCVYAVLVTSVVSDSLRPHGLWPTRPLCPWDSLSKNAGVGCHALLQRIFPIQRLNSCLLVSYTARQILYPCCDLGSPYMYLYTQYINTYSKMCLKILWLGSRPSCQVRITTKQVTWIFWFPSAYKLCLHYSVVC